VASQYDSHTVRESGGLLGHYCGDHQMCASGSGTSPVRQQNVDPVRTNRGSAVVGSNDHGSYVRRVTLRALVIALLAVAGTAGGCRAPTHAPRPATSVWAWGFNNYGQIGNGSKIQVSEPIRLSLSDVTQVQASFHNSLALKKMGASGSGAALTRKSSPRHRALIRPLHRDSSHAI
jgi:Regulator of chromosome condensation (RCC1) repeat